ncbi:MAG: hypothetical protein MJ082_00835 [Clostridia bacterium]|nr:hypothetical protein [Clostridia bacterium]
MAKKTLKEELLEKLNPLTAEDFDRAFGVSGEAERLINYYESKEGVSLNDFDYLVGQGLAAAADGADISKENVADVCGTVKNAVDAYKKTSAFGRFFSYLNPFPNKYRTMRNEIKEAKEFLSEKGIDRDDLEAFCNGEKEIGDVKFPEIGENQQVVNTLNGKEKLIRENLRTDYRTEDLPGYLKVQEYRKFFNREEFDLDKDRMFAEKLDHMIDRATLDIKEQGNYAEMRSKEWAVLIEGMYDEQEIGSAKIPVEISSNKLGLDFEEEEEAPFLPDNPEVEDKKEKGEPKVD